MLKICPNWVEILLCSYKRDLGYCLQTVKDGVTKRGSKYDSPSSEVGMVVSRGVQEKKKDQQVATVVRDRTMKLEEVSSSP